MRFLYTLLFYLALPLIFIRLLLKSRKQPAYRHRLAERVGIYRVRFRKCIWVHAVSLGETIAAIPLVKALQAAYPEMPIVITTMTVTGAERVRQTFGKTVTHVYIPYDIPTAVARFLRAMNPVIAIIMETEMWPNLFAACYDKSIPICLVNARLSAKSAKRYARVPGLTKTMLNQIDVIATHGERDAERFIELGASKNKVVVTGNIKFDLEIPAPLFKQCETLREQLGKDRFIWIAASTHEGEETQILAAHKNILAQHPDALLILVPRHPERFNGIAKLIEPNFHLIRRSQDQACTPQTSVYLGDTMGELLLLYGVSDAAFVGGSLIARGGHNILEPAAFGKAILTGPHVFNFAEMSSLFVDAGAMQIVEHQDALEQAIHHLIVHADLRQEMGKKAKDVMHANRGALAKQLQVIQTKLKLS